MTVGRGAAFQAKLDALKRYKESPEAVKDTRWSKLQVDAEHTYIWGVRDCPRCKAVCVSVDS